MERLGGDLETARRSVQVAKHGPPVAGGQLQRRIAVLETQLAASDSDAQQLTVHHTTSMCRDPQAKPSPTMAYPDYSVNGNRCSRVPQRGILRAPVLSWVPSPTVATPPN